MAKEFKRLTNGTVAVRDTVTGKTKRYTKGAGVCSTSIDSVNGDQLNFYNAIGFIIFKYLLSDVTLINDVAAPTDADEKAAAISELFGDVPLNVTLEGSGGSGETGLAKDNTIAGLSNKVATDQTIKERLPILDGVNLPVTVKASVLPTGAATATGQAAIAQAISNIPAPIPFPTTLAKTADISAVVDAVNALSGITQTNTDAISTIKDGLDTLAEQNETIIAAQGDTQKVLVVNATEVGGGSTSGATSANQTTANASLSSIDTKLGGTGIVKTKVLHDPTVSGFTSNSRVVSASGNNNTTLHGAAVLINTIYAYNATASVKFVHLANVSGAAIGTTVPSFTLAVPANGSAQFNGNGEMRFGTALSFWFTTDVAGNVTTGIGANDLLFYISYMKA